MKDRLLSFFSIVGKLQNAPLSMFDVLRKSGEVGEQLEALSEKILVAFHSQKHLFLKYSTSERVINEFFDFARVLHRRLGATSVVQM